MKISDDQNTITLDDGRQFRAVPEIEPGCYGCDLEHERCDKVPCVPTRTVGDGMRKDGERKIFRNAAEIPDDPLAEALDHLAKMLELAEAQPGTLEDGDKQGIAQAQTFLKQNGKA